jgi:hypothetical protein
MTRGGGTPVPPPRFVVGLMPIGKDVRLSWTIDSFRGDPISAGFPPPRPGGSQVRPALRQH